MTKRKKGSSRVSLGSNESAAPSPPLKKSKKDAAKTQDKPEEKIPLMEGLHRVLNDPAKTYISWTDEHGGIALIDQEAFFQDMVGLHAYQGLTADALCRSLVSEYGFVKDDHNEYGIPYFRRPLFTPKTSLENARNMTSLVLQDRKRKEKEKREREAKLKKEGPTDAQIKEIYQKSVADRLSAKIKTKLQLARNNLIDPPASDSEGTAQSPSPVPQTPVSNKTTSRLPSSLSKTSVLNRPDPATLPSSSLQKTHEDKKEAEESEVEESEAAESGTKGSERTASPMSQRIMSGLDQLQGSYTKLVTECQQHADSQNAVVERLRAEVLEYRRESKKEIGALRRHMEEEMESLKR
jgi:hypothetical protein